MKIKMILRLAYERFFSIINIFRTKHLYEARTGKEKQKLTAEEMETIMLYYVMTLQTANWMISYLLKA